MRAADEEVSDSSVHVRGNAPCRRMTMVIEDTYDFKPNYYSFSTRTPRRRENHHPRGGADEGERRKPVPLESKGWDCIAAVHAYAAEPQLFSSVKLLEPPPSWTEMLAIQIRRATPTQWRCGER